MKKIILLIMLSFTSVLFAQDNIEVSKTLDNNQKLKSLPGAVKTYITKKYPNDSILKAGYKRYLWVKTYEVHLDKWIIEFDENGNWIKNYTPDGTANLDYLPEDIKQIMSKNYPKQKIVKLEQKQDNLYVYLDNNKNLSFKYAAK
jgi:hypothetical protein